MICNIIMGSLKDKGIKVPNGTYVTFTSDNENMIMTPKVTQSGTVLYFSADNGFGESTGEWKEWTPGSTISIGKTVHMKGTAKTKSLYSSSNNSNAWSFINSNNLVVTGNLNYLLCDNLGLTAEVVDEMFISASKL